MKKGALVIILLVLGFAAVLPQINKNQALAIPVPDDVRQCTYDTNCNDSDLCIRNFCKPKNQYYKEGNYDENTDYRIETKGQVSYIPVGNNDRSTLTFITRSGNKRVYKLKLKKSNLIVLKLINGAKVQSVTEWPYKSLGCENINGGKIKGRCQYKHNTCDLGYIKGYCEGDDNFSCCINTIKDGGSLCKKNNPTGTSARRCESTIDNPHVANHSNGKYVNNLCRGFPSSIKCWVPNIYKPPVIN